MLLADRADVIPGRSLTRSKKVFGRWAAHAQGALITDTEGRQYIDMLCGLGAVSLGYHQPMPGAAGGVYSLPHAAEVDAAEAVLADVAPWGSWVRFLKTGSESTHAAYRIAKALTGRSQVCRIDGSYHGWHEWCAAPGQLPVGFIPAPATDYAAVIVEPPRFANADRSWLQALRWYCDVAGALLVFDSMLYGGRWSIGGASKYFDVTPDLECFGKAYGNGASVAFVVGTDRTLAHGEIPSGTFSGEVSGLYALLNTLAFYKTFSVVGDLWARGEQLRAGLCRVIPPELGTVEASAVAACQRIAFQRAEDKQPFCDAMLEHGVIWHPEVTYTMYAHSAAHIDRVIEAAGVSALAVLA